MNRIQPKEINNAPEEVASLYEAVNKKLGLVPNMVKVFGNSPASLQGYLGLSGAVSAGKLQPVTREKIALVVAELNDCEYCLSAHHAIGGLLKIPAGDLEAAQRGESNDPKEQAILNLARSVLETRGAVPNEVYEEARAVGVTEEEAIEVVTHVALNVLTNSINRFAETEIDFPKVSACGCAFVTA